MTDTRVLFLLGILASAAACSEDLPAAPTAPATPAAPTLSGLTISGLDAVRTGFFSDYVATATMSDGSSQVVTATAAWSSSDSAIGAVSSAGRLTGQTHGTMDITASYQGRTASKTVSIVNNYGGTWTGSYTVTTCDASGDFGRADWCKDKRGRTFSLTLTLSQTGADRSQVSGTLNNQFIAGAPVNGNVTADGRLNIGTNATGTSSGIAFRFQLLGFETRVTAPAQMSGRTAVSLSATGLAGNAYEEHNITNATLSNPQLLPVGVSADMDRLRAARAAARSLGRTAILMSLFVGVLRITC